MLKAINLKTEIIKDKLRPFIHALVEQTGLSKDDIDDSTLLISSGIIDSLHTLQIVDFLEDNFELKIRMEHMEGQNFDSIELLASFVADTSN
jgi:acyl carrier protein